jgi:uncharacterized protein
MFRQIADYLVFDLFSMSAGSKPAEFVHFIIYDSLKIFILLFSLIFVIAIIRTYIPLASIKRAMEGRNKILGHFLASIFGVLTPFCSCSSIPIFLGFLKSGLPVGLAFSFLITSPLANEYLIVLMASFFGLKITGIYVLCGILLGVISGMILGKIGIEKHIEREFISSGVEVSQAKFENFNARIKLSYKETSGIISKIWKWIIFAITLGAIIHNYVPTETITRIAHMGGFFSVPLAALFGIPMYGSCSAILPLAFVLFDKGIPLGTVLALMMGISALSLPEAIILRRAMKLKLIAIFFTIVFIGIVTIGYILNSVHI